MQIGLIGNGSWATALAKMLTDNGHVVHWWMRNEKSVQHIITKHHNPDYLSSVYFKSGVSIPTSDLKEVIANNDIILFCTPSAFMMDVLNQLHPADLINKKIISAIKGLILEENVLLNDYLETHFQVALSNYVSITGPCHAEEIAQERLSYLTFSGFDQQLVNNIAELFKGCYLHTVINEDLYGAQYAAVLKNIYAVGAGIASGLGYGDNFLSVYVTNCYNEMFRFLTFHNKQKGNVAANFNSSAYLGDLLVTCYSQHSRNRTFGNLVGKGYLVKNGGSEMNMVAEGYYAVAGMQAIISNMLYEMPIVSSIFNILKNGNSAQEVFLDLEATFK